MNAKPAGDDKYFVNLNVSDSTLPIGNERLPEFVDLPLSESVPLSGIELTI